MSPLASSSPARSARTSTAGVGSENSVLKSSQEPGDVLGVLAAGRPDVGTL